MRIRLSHLRRIIREALEEQGWTPGRWYPGSGEPLSDEEVALMGTGGLGGEDPDEDETQLEEKKGLWDNIWARRRAGKRPKRPGEKGYPETLDIESDLNEASLTVKGLRKSSFEDVRRKYPEFAKILLAKFGESALSSASFALSPQGIMGIGGKVPVVFVRYDAPVLYCEDDEVKYNSSVSLARAIERIQ